LKKPVIDRPNQVWGTDITYVSIRGGFAYLCAVTNWGAVLRPTSTVISSSAKQPERRGAAAAPPSHPAAKSGDGKEADAPKYLRFLFDPY